MKRHTIIRLTALVTIGIGMASLAVAPGLRAQGQKLIRINGALNLNSQASGDPGSMEVSPSSLTFGFVQVGLSSPGQTVTVTNSGKTAVTINSVTVSSNFVKSNSCPSVLDAG